MSGGVQRAAARLEAKRVANATFYANLPKMQKVPRQAARRFVRKATKAEATRVRQEIIRNRRKRVPS